MNVFLITALTTFAMCPSVKIELAHHKDLRKIVCYRVIDWDPPFDAECERIGSTSMDIPIFHCCGPE